MFKLTMFLTLFTVTTSLALSSWIAFCIVTYLWHYFIEVVLDLPIIGQSPCSAHASLKLLIQRVIQEAIGLPELRRAQEHPAAPAENINQSYEDLLATAILNKVILNYQDELPTSSANSVCSRISNSSRHRDKEYFFGEETLDVKWKQSNSTAGDIDTTSISSLEELVRSDSSIGSTKYFDRVSLTIQQRIEEISSSDDEAVEKPLLRKINSENDEWQDNWLMQKRKIGGSVSPVPVAMLVPNPTIEAKVLIGDRDAEDTTDLSDAASDYGDTESRQDIQSVLVESKTVIGGKNLLGNLNTSNDVSDDSSTDVSDIEEEKEQILEQFASSIETSGEVKPSETINETLINQTTNIDDDAVDNSLNSLESQTEKDSEYTEKFGTLPRTILKSPTPTSRNLKNLTENFAKNNENGFKSEDNEHIEPSENKTFTNGTYRKSFNEKDDKQQNDVFKGSYSQREKDKWKNAVELKNNPYSSENLNRRLSGRSSNGNDNQIYGRDYYIKESASAAGERKKTESTKTEEVSDIIKAIKEKPLHSSQQLNSESFVFKAVAVIIDTETDESSIELTSPVRSNTFELSSDSDLSVERVYNLPSGKVFENVGDNQREKNPILKENAYIAKSTELRSSKLILDENHNTMSKTHKESDLSSSTEPNITNLNQDQTNTNDVKDEVLVNAQNNNKIVNNVPLEENEKDKISKEAEEHCNSMESKEFSLEFSTDENEEITKEPTESVNSDPEIVDLKGKHLVKERLGQFSKSYQDLAAVPLRKSISIKEKIGNLSNTENATDKILPKYNSVENLLKQSDKEQIQLTKEEAAKRQVYSLTARSIPREFRQELKGEKGKDESDNSKTDLTAKNQNGASEEERIFPNTKNKIKFFENLNR